jgi:FkbM family methyltransferase
MREMRGGGYSATYELREMPVRVVVRHGSGDAVTLGEVFHEHHYVPPPELDGALDPALILDLGANIGMFGAYASARWPAARIVAYEPDPANAAICSRCIDENALNDRWKLHRAAAAAARGSLRFKATGDAISRADDQGELVVEARDVLPDLASADLVKMDIEGGEWALLADPRFVKAPPRALVIEYHPHQCPGPDPRRLVEQVLRDAGLSRQTPIFHRADGHGMLWAWQG